MISELIRNPAYIGVLRCGEASNHIEELRIVSDEIFDKAQEIKKQRVLENSNKQKCATGRSNALLSGLLFCGTCGGRLNSKKSNRTHYKVDGSVQKWVAHRYACYNRHANKKRCNGKTSHTASAIDEVVLKIMDELFKNMKNVNINSLTSINNTKKKDFNLRLKKANTELKKLDTRLEKLNYKAICIISGESTFSSENLNNMIDMVKKDREKIVSQISEESFFH